MAGLKEIRRRISSVKNTKQITRAMKLVSAAKLRRAQDAAVNGRAFVDGLSEIMATVLGDLPSDFSHPLLERREQIRSRCIIVVAGERGLCGAYNSNVIKSVSAELAGRSGPAVPSQIIPLGRRAASAGRRLGWEVPRSFEGLPEDANRWPINELSEMLIKGFEDRQFDEVAIVYTKFVSAMTQRVTREVLLPVTKESLFVESADAAQSAHSGQVKYSPSALETFGELLPILIHSKILRAGLEAKASEHAARMTAMDSATSNADDLISKLRLYYNRARQNAITKELLDIIGGAEALG